MRGTSNAADIATAANKAIIDIRKLLKVYEDNKVLYSGMVADWLDTNPPDRVDDNQWCIRWYMKTPNTPLFYRGVARSDDLDFLNQEEKC